MEQYNPLFGEPPFPPPAPRKRDYGFKYKNYRLQLPNILFDIESLDVNNLPANIRYYGQFFYYKDKKDKLIVFRFNDLLVFHTRTNGYDGQTYFPIDVLKMIVPVFESIAGITSQVINVFGNNQEINWHKIQLLSIAGKRPGEEGFWLRDYSVSDVALVAMGAEGIADNRMEEYLSNYGLFEAGGLQILQAALQDLNR